MGLRRVEVKCPTQEAARDDEGPAKGRQVGDDHNRNRARPPAHEQAEPLSLTIEICAVRVCVTGLDAALRKRLVDVLRPFVSETEPVPCETLGARVRVWRVPEEGGWRLAPDDYTTQFFDDPHRLIAQLEWLVMVHAHELSSGRALFHGAALARGETVVLLTGDSGAGKTTLTLGLMQRGWLPLTDDVVVVDRETLRISAFPRCFHLDRHTASRVVDRSLLEWLGSTAAGGNEEYARPLRWATQSPSPACLVSVERPADGPSQSSPITFAEAASRLLASTLTNQLSNRERVAVVARMAATARRCVRLTNGDLDGALDLIEAAAAP